LERNLLDEGHHSKIFCTYGYLYKITAVKGWVGGKAREMGDGPVAAHEVLYTFQFEERDLSKIIVMLRIDVK
jgi:hypothetical protein